jgi:hypothetical protein
MQVTSVKQTTFVMDEKKLIILVQDYDNNLLKDNCWNEITGELHPQGKEFSQRTQQCRRMVG